MSLVKNLCEVGYDYRVKNRVFNATIRCVLKKRKIVIHIFSFLFACSDSEGVKIASVTLKLLVLFEIL
jgi:transcriptional regulator